VTRVKVCGITNAADADLAIEMGADALGFILVPDTPRCVGDRPEALAAALNAPPFVCTVAVVRDVPEVDRRIVDGFDAVQFYSGCVVGRPWRRIRALRVRDASVLDEVARLEPECDAFVLDAYHPAKLGGSGETFDWEIAREAVARTSRPIILAGGLTPENAADAIAAVRPYAVDVSSGVEAEPGRKDPAKLRAFFRAVREADAAVE